MLLSSVSMRPRSTRPATRAESFVKLAKGLEPFNEKNGDHTWLVDFIDEEGGDFYQRGGEHRVKEGKSFLPRAHYHEAVRAGKGGQYWTFSDSEIVDLLEVRATRDARANVEGEIKRLEALGFSRGAAPTPAKKPAAVEEAPAPKATRNVVPAPGGDPVDTESGNTVFKVLGY